MYVCVLVCLWIQSMKTLAVVVGGAFGGGG